MYHQTKCCRGVKSAGVEQCALRGRHEEARNGNERRASEGNPVESIRGKRVRLCSDYTTRALPQALPHVFSNRSKETHRQG